MGIFKKKGVDVVDLTNMQKRGLISSKNFNDKNDFEDLIDLSKNSNSSDNNDFLSGLAGAGNFNSNDKNLEYENLRNIERPITSSLREARHRINASSEINELRLKLDDNEFKLSSLIEKVKEVERRLNERGI